MLRATLHTDTLRAADRQRALPERNTQSADVNRDSWSRPAALSVGMGMGMGMGPSAPIATTPKAAAPGQRPNAGVARTLAPNGQPRKVPVAMLPHYHAMAAMRPHGGSSIIASASGAPGPDVSRIKTAAQIRFGLHSK